MRRDKLKKTFGWKPVWNIETAVEKTVEFSKLLKEDHTTADKVISCMNSQIKDYIKTSNQCK